LLKKRILTKAPMRKSVFVSTIEEAISIEILVMGMRKRIPSKKVANKRLSQRLIFRYIRTMMTAKTIPTLINSTI
jgi:transposase